MTDFDDGAKYRAAANARELYARSDSNLGGCRPSTDEEKLAIAAMQERWREELAAAKARQAELQEWFVRLLSVLFPGTGGPPLTAEEQKEAERERSRRQWQEKKAAKAREQAHEMMLLQEAAKRAERIEELREWLSRP
jgi:hypothetical protein